MRGVQGVRKHGNRRRTWSTLAHILCRAGRLEADPPVLTVVFLAHGGVWVVHGRDGRHLTEGARVAARTQAPVRVEAVLTRGAVLTDV